MPQFLHHVVPTGYLRLAVRQQYVDDRERENYDVVIGLYFRFPPLRFYMNCLRSNSVRCRETHSLRANARISYSKLENFFDSCPRLRLTGTRRIFNVC